MQGSAVQAQTDMQIITDSERRVENRSLGRKLAVFIVLYIVATTCFIIFA